MVKTEKISIGRHQRSEMRATGTKFLSFSWSSINNASGSFYRFDLYIEEEEVESIVDKVLRPTCIV